MLCLLHNTEFLLHVCCFVILWMCDVQHGFALLAYNAHSSNMIPCSCPDVEPSHKYLPQMIGDKVPTEDGKWECFFLLHDILQLCTATVSSSALTGLPEALIDHHHTLFIQCYPHSSVTPKIQYMVHFPHQVIRYCMVITCIISFINFFTQNWPIN